MNVIAAPFAFVLPELVAFHALDVFFRRIAPFYVQPNIEGARGGQALVALCLRDLDQVLYNQIGNASQAFLQFVMSFMAGLRPLKEVLKLWDYFLVKGFHYNVLAFIAILMLMRNEILAKPTE